MTDDTHPVGLEGRCDCGMNVVWVTERPTPGHRGRLLMITPLPNTNGTVILSANLAVAVELEGDPLGAAQKGYGGPLYARHDLTCRQAAKTKPPVDHVSQHARKVKRNEDRWLTS